MMRPIPGFSGYHADEDGVIWSTCRNAEPRQLRPAPDNRGGYLRVQIAISEGIRVHRAVHSLVLMAFVGPRPKGMQCRHLDGNNLNNRPENLRWGTAKENYSDRIAHGTDAFPQFRDWRKHQTHCVHGHEYTLENTGHRGNGRRKCLTCYPPQRNRGYKLTTDDAIQIRQLLSEGLSQQVIAARYGVSKGAVGCIARGETHKPGAFMLELADVISSSPCAAS